MPNSEHTATNQRPNYIPNGWTAKIVNGETVFQSPSRAIETSDIERVQQAVKSGGER